MYRFVKKQLGSFNSWFCLSYWTYNSESIFPIIFQTVQQHIFTTNWKFWYCCTHCLFGVNECQWLVCTHTFPFIPNWCYLIISMIPQYLLSFHWLYAQSMNSRLAMMSASLRTQTGLHCLIIQVLHTRVWFLNIRYTSLTSVHSNLEHGLAILTESFSPLRSVLHNLSFWSLKQKSTSIDTQYNFLTSVAFCNTI